MSVADESVRRASGGAPVGLSGSALLVSSGTVVSRITGLLRDVVVFTWLGISPSMDALVLALRIPGTFYRFVVDAGFIRLLVPRLIAAEDRSAYVATTFLPCVLVVAAAAALIWLLTPALIALIAPGFDPEQRELASALIRIAVFYIPLSFATGYLAALLNSRLRYGVPAYIQVVINLSVAAGTATLAVFFEQPHRVVVLSMIGGGVLQILILVVPLWRLKDLPRLRLALMAPEFRALLAGLGTMLAVTMPQQLSLWISFAIGSQVEVGAPSRLYLAERIIQLPLAVIGITLATVALPVLSRLERAGRSADFARTLDWGAQVGILLSVPMVVGFWLLGDQVLAVLFGWREIAADEIDRTFEVVRAMLPAVPFAVLTQLLGAGYFSRQRYGAMVLASIFGAVVLSVSAWYLALRLGYGGPGIGWGTSLGLLANAVWLTLTSVRGGQWSPALAPWLGFALRLTIACALMALAVQQLRALATGVVPLFPLLLAEVLLGALVYFAVLRVLGMRFSDWYRTPVRLDGD